MMWQVIAGILVTAFVFTIILCAIIAVLLMVAYDNAEELTEEEIEEIVANNEEGASVDTPAIEASENANE